MCRVETTQHSEQLKSAVLGIQRPVKSYVYQIERKAQLFEEGEEKENRKNTQDIMERLKGKLATVIFMNVFSLSLYLSTYSLCAKAKREQ